MDVFKLFESTVPEIQLDYAEAKDLRRDQLLDNYDAAVKALQSLIKAKENEIAYRRALVEMLEQSKAYLEKKKQAPQQSIGGGEQSPDSIGQYNPEDIFPASKSNTPQSNLSTTPISSGTTPAGPTTPNTLLVSANDHIRSSTSTAQYQPSLVKSGDLDLPTTIPPPDRTSLDNRLSEFLKTYPILSQAGLTAPQTSTADNNQLINSNNDMRPSPGYYTPQHPQPTGGTITNPPPLMAMMRFPPPPMIPGSQQPPSLSNLNLSGQENHEAADMDLSDHDEPSSSKAGMIPMIASAMQQGAGGKQGLPRSEQSPYGSGGYNNPVQFAAATSRMGALPFDPSIMDPTFSSPMSSGSSSRDKHSQNERGSHRHSSSGGSSSSKHGSDKNSKYSSSSQSSKNKRR